MVLIKFKVFVIVPNVSTNLLKFKAGETDITQLRNRDAVDLADRLDHDIVRVCVTADSIDAWERFDELLDKLRQQLTQSYFNQMAGAMSQVSPEDMARMKDMLSSLNEMLEQRQRGEEPDFESFMERFGDFFPENPENLDELLEIMAERMAAMQAMLNSMTPEQRAQLQGLSDQLMEDMDLRWQMDQLGQNLQNLFPQKGWGRSYDFSGQDPLGFAEAAQMMQELGDIDQLENLLRGATSPGALAEVDLDRARELLGDDAAKSLVPFFLTICIHAVPGGLVSLVITISNLVSTSSLRVAGACYFSRCPMRNSPALCSASWA